MKIKNIRISIRNRKKALKEFAETFQRVKEGQAVYGHDEVSFESIRAFRKVFTEKRMELLHIIKERSPGSIYELAKMAGRDLKSVSTDIQNLQQLDLLTVKRLEDKRNRVKPVVDFDTLRLDIAL